MIKNYKNFILHFILLSLVSLDIHSKEPESPQPSAPPNIGNFALPSSQQPGPLVSFGQSIIDKGQTQLFLEPTYLQKKNQQYLAATPSLLYGLYDTASITLTLPVALNYRTRSSRSSGLSDAVIQLEYAFFVDSSSQATQQATFVTAATVPSGSLYKNPATGFGTASFFLGGTYNITFVDWVFFTSPGALLITTHNNIKLGSQYLYQFGMERLILSSPNKYILAGMMELNGIYAQKNEVFGHLLPNSGGNILGITPSIWFSTQKLIVQLGVSFTIVQKLNGNQIKSNYLLSANFSWNFNV